MSQRAEKLMAADYAAGLVDDGMTVGLGSGTTAELVIHALGRRHREGLKLVGVPTSERSAEIAGEYGIPLGVLTEYPRLDMTIDGADEIDPNLNLIKGHGGALLREKIVALSTDRYVIVVDPSKLVAQLGERVTVPVEVVAFGWDTTQARLKALGCACGLRRNHQPFMTSGGNFILNCRLTEIGGSIRDVADAVKLQTGVIEHGLFLDLSPTVIVGTPSGQVDVLKATR